MLSPNILTFNFPIFILLAMSTFRMHLLIMDASFNYMRPPALSNLCGGELLALSLCLSKCSMSLYVRSVSWILEVFSKTFVNDSCSFVFLRAFLDSNLSYENILSKILYFFILPLSSLKKQAIASGYFFRCPTCNNQDLFLREMKIFGIYIPER